MAKVHRFIQEFITGLFVVAVIAALAFFTIVISGVDLLRGSDEVLRQVAFTHIGTLKVQDPVVVRGLQVGSVQALSLEPDVVVATLRMRADIPLYSDYSITVGPTSLLGGACVQVVAGSSGAPLPSEQRLHGTPPRETMRELGELIAELRKAIDPDELRATLTNVRHVSDDLVDLTDRLRSGEGMLGKLLSPEDTMYDELHATITNLREVSNGLREGKGLLGKLLREDDAAYADLRDTLANIKTLSARLNDPTTGAGRLLGGDSPLITDLEATVANLRSVSEKLSRGEGTLGQLVNDDAVADEMRATIRDVRQIIDNMRDTAPITTFTSLFFSGL